MISKFLFMTLLIFAGCESKELKTDNTLNTKTETSFNTLKPVLYKGMFNKNSLSFLQCETMKTFSVSQEGDFSALDKEFELKQNKTIKKSYYIEAEGFSSVKEKSGERNFDTILVITKFLKLDSANNCIK